MQYEQSRRRLQTWIKIGAAVLLSISSSACSSAFFRDKYFPNFRPAPPPRVIDAAAVIESTAGSSIDANLGEAFRQIVTEELATLFARVLPAKGSGEDIVLVNSVAIQGVFPPTTVTVTATLMDARTGSKLASYTRSARDSTFIGETRLQRVADQFIRNILPGIKEDLLKALDNPAILPARYLPQSPPGLQSDR